MVIEGEEMRGVTRREEYVRTMWRPLPIITTVGWVGPGVSKLGLRCDPLTRFSWPPRDGE